MAEEHTVSEGECIATIAFAYGFFVPTLEDHPNNRDLVELRGNLSTLVPGDVVFIPTKQPKELSGAIDQKHRFRRRGVPEHFVQRFLDIEGEPRTGIPFTAAVDGVAVEGETDDKGAVDLWISPAARKVVLTLHDGQDEPFEFELGTLAPSNSIEGLQQRLRQLSRYEGPLDGELNEELQAELKHVQADFGLPVTGEIDDATEAAVVAWYEGGEPPDED